MIGAIVLAAAVASPQQFAALPLAAALQRAVANSPDVAQARDRVAEEQALLSAARGLAAPALTANYAQAPQGGPNNTTIAQRLVTVGAQITLGDYTSASPAIRQAAFALSATRYDYLNAQRAERIKVSGQYYDALKAGAEVRVRAADVSGAQSDLRAARLRFNAGDAPRLDVVRADVALAAAQAALGSARVAFENARQALAVETGAPPQSLAALSAAPLLAPPINADAAIARALAQRSDLASARQAVLGEQAALGVAQRATMPAITLGAGYTTGTDSGVYVRGPSATVNVLFPLSHAASDRIAAERARFAQAVDKNAAIQRDITVTVGAAARTYAQSAQSAQAASRARAAAAQELRATEIGYRNGASSSLDVADARRVYVQSELAELDAIYAKAQAAAALEEEMGP